MKKDSETTIYVCSCGPFNCMDSKIWWKEISFYVGNLARSSDVFFLKPDSFKNHDVYISVLTAERKKREACAHVEKADEKHPSEDVVPAEVMMDEPDGASILWQGKAT